MASGDKPGTLCLTHSSEPIDTGTLSRMCMPSPGPMCLIPENRRVTTLAARLEATNAIRRLFDSCLVPDTTLTDADYQKAADELKVEVEIVRAVAKVEAPRGPFDGDGHPTILFERHYFHRFTAGAHDKKYPVISQKKGGGYGKFAAQYGKLEAAYNLDASAALKSASWGKFQIMGSNYEAAGYGSVEEMVASMMKSEKNQLFAFVRFLKSDAKMLDALQKKSWADFARRYNGKEYAKNEYDKKLKEAYEAEVKKKPKPIGVPPATGATPGAAKPGASKPGPTRPATPYRSTG